MTTTEKKGYILDFCCNHADCNVCPLASINCNVKSMTPDEADIAYEMAWRYLNPAKPETPEEPTEAEEPMRHFSTGAVRDSAVGKGRYDLLPWGAIHALAQHVERGAIHYGERNVDLGINQSSLIDSGVRHLSQYIQGDPEPYHLVAALWNIAWACEQELKRPEMIDLPERTEASGRAV